MIRRLPSAAFAALFACQLGVALTAAADTSSSADGLTLERIMADPEWMGAPPESFYFSDDGTRVYFEQRRKGERVVRDLSVVDVASGTITAVPDAERSAIDAAEGVFDHQRLHQAFIRNGDLFVRTQSDGRVRQLTLYFNY